MLPLHAANHRYLNMNTQKAPFNDVRVRQAFALALNRPSIVQGLWGKYGELGNDSPMWPRLRVHEPSRCPQRHQQIAQAKALLKAAGKENLKVTLTCYRSFEMPDYAQRVAQDLKKIGVDCTVKVYTSAQYFDGVSFGAAGKLAPWLVDGLRHRRLRRPARADHVPERRAPQGRRLERGAVLEPEVREARWPSSTPHRTWRRRRSTPRRSSSCSCTTRLRSTRTSTTSSPRRSKKVHGYVPDGMGWINLRKVTIG